MAKRIIGIDVARALAVIGMIIVNFRMIFGEQGESWIKSASHLLDGKAAATFVVLAGVGLALMTNSAVKNNDQEKLGKLRLSIVKKAAILFLVGLSYISIWPADILHFYSVYMLATLLFISKSSKQILAAVVAIIALYPLLLFVIDYDTGWDFTSLEYSGFWTFKGFFRNLFYNGFHPAIPWTAFMLFGLWYGKQNLTDNKFLKRSLLIGIATFISVQLLSAGLILLLSDGSNEVAKELTQILGTAPMPPLPIYMLVGISISVVIISASILVSKKYASSAIIKALNNAGKMALTFYVAHIVIGVGVMEEIRQVKLGDYSIHFSIGYAVLFSMSCIIFASVWLKYFKSGPLEWVMRKLSS